MLVTENKEHVWYCCHDIYNFCRHSNCMAWRWYDPAMKVVPEDAGLIPWPDRRGFCGLAGKPEVTE